MIAKYTRTGLIWGISGLILQTVCYALLKSIQPQHHAHQAVPPEWVAYALLGGVVLGTVLFILGLCDYAKAKGYSGFWGLLGFCSWPGLVIVAILPDRTKK
jgi:hypothetical protein